MKYTATNIKWDSDGEDIDLPTELTIDIPNDVFVKMDGEEIDEFISDYITNEIGFCHMGFSLK
jgi:hypothetical protein